MALWSVDVTERDRKVLAEGAPEIEPIFQFSNLPSYSQRHTSSGERVRSLAFDKHNYVCLITSIMFLYLMCPIITYSY